LKRNREDSLRAKRHLTITYPLTLCFVVFRPIAIPPTRSGRKNFTRIQKKKPCDQGFEKKRKGWQNDLAEPLPPTLAANAAHAVGTNHVDHVANLLNSRNVAYRFLDELFQVKGRQTSFQDQRPATVLNVYVIDSAAKMRVMLQMLASQRTQVIAFARL
jgi:hypothetical protein